MGFSWVGLNSDTVQIPTPYPKFEQMRYTATPVLTLTRNFFS